MLIPEIMRKPAVMALPGILLCANACVNEDYDFNNGIDTTVGIQGDISAPLGNTEFIPVGDFLKLDQEEGTESVLVKKENGDYYLSMAGDSPVTQSFEIPSVNISPENLIQDGGFDLIIDMSGIGGTGSLPDQDIPLPGIPSAETRIMIDESVTGINAVVKAIGIVAVDAPVEMKISLKDNGQPLSKGEIILADGFTVSLPDCIRLKDKTGNGYSVKGNVITVAPTTVSGNPTTVSGNPTTVNAELEMIDLSVLQQEGQGYIYEDGRIYVDQPVTLSDIDGISVNPSTFGQTAADLPDSPSIDVTINITSLDVIGLTARIEPDITVDNQSISLGELPEFLTGDDIVLDVYNPVIVLDASLRSNGKATADDRLPEFMVNADIKGYDAEGKDLGNTVHIGASDASDSRALVVKYGSNRIYVSRRPVDMPPVEDPSPVFTNPPVNVLADNLSDIVKVLPSTLSFENILIESATDDFAVLRYPETGSLTYDVELGYSFETALAFGSGLKINYAKDFTDWNKTFNQDSEESDFTVDMREATISFSISSSIPLGMKVSASPLDTDGNVMTEGITAELDGTVLPGDTERVSRTDLTVYLTATPAALKMFDGLRLNISADSPDPAYEGVTLNANQGVRLENIVANIKGGVNLK